jgi:hypothetical protein
MKYCTTLYVERSLVSSVPPDEGGLTTETYRGDTGTNI